MTDHPSTDTTTPIRMDRAWLAGLGLAGLADHVKVDLLETAYDTLERRVGTRIANRLSNDDLDRFEKIFQDRDDKAALAFLQQTCPDYTIVVRSELNRLEAEIRHAAPAILCELPTVNHAGAAQ